MDSRSPENLVQLRGLSLTLPSASGPVRILDNITLDLPPNRSIGLIGPSGSGKTSLLMLIAGLERATSGTVHVAGENLSTRTEDELARFRRHNIGIVFQNFHLIPTMTALENVALPLELAAASNPTARAQASLAAVGLAHRLTHLPGQLSGGEQQRVAVARAFVAEPRLLLADEPTGNLDTATGAAVMDLLFAERARLGSTLLLITHDPALAASCDATIRLQNGKLL
jgi:putative ABC transport system ATP-binding protein